MPFSSLALHHIQEQDPTTSPGCRVNESDKKCRFATNIARFFHIFLSSTRPNSTSAWRQKRKHYRENHISADVYVKLRCSAPSFTYGITCRVAATLCWMVDTTYIEQRYRASINITWLLGSCAQEFAMQFYVMFCLSRQVAPGTVTYSISFPGHNPRNLEIVSMCMKQDITHDLHIFRSSVAKREPTFLPFISQVMCGAGCAFDVVQLADSFSPTVNWRLLNVMRGGPVCWAAKYNRNDFS